MWFLQLTSVFISTVVVYMYIYLYVYLVQSRVQTVAETFDLLFRFHGWCQSWIGQLRASSGYFNLNRCTFLRPPLGTYSSNAGSLFQEGRGEYRVVQSNILREVFHFPYMPTVSTLRYGVMHINIWVCPH